LIAALVARLPVEARKSHSVRQLSCIRRPTIRPGSCHVDAGSSLSKYVG
jgi:hypothetical protein